MREIEFRGIHKTSGDFAYSMTISNGTIKRKHSEIYFEVSENKWVGVELGTIGEYTGLKDNNGIKIYEGDIVKVFADRERMYGSATPKSKHDLSNIETRSVIRLKDFKWMLDLDTGYNNEIIDFKGKEEDVRTLSVHEDLGNYLFFQPEHPSHEFNNKQNSHAYWSRIEVIGNIHQNPELLEATK